MNIAMTSKYQPRPFGRATHHYVCEAICIACFDAPILSHAIDINGAARPKIDQREGHIGCSISPLPAKLCSDQQRFMVMIFGLLISSFGLFLDREDGGNTLPRTVSERPTH
jgi:hypothetical protein